LDFLEGDRCLIEQLQLSRSGARDVSGQATKT
jgi:hypothetical protein